MGLAILYSGTIKSEKAKQFLELVRSECGMRNWPITVAEQSVVEKSLFGLVKKPVLRPFIRIEPDEDCDPLCFTFDINWKVDDFVKTSFADIEIHKSIIELFESFSAAGFRFEILDDSEYYPSKDNAVLERNRLKFFEMLENEYEKGAVGPFKTPEGRIVDCYYPENE